MDIFATALKILREATSKMPSLRYAWFGIGLVAAATIVIMLSKNDPKRALFTFLFSAAAFILILVVLRAQDVDLGLPASIFIYVATLCASLCVIFTLSAYSFGIPCNWAPLVGAKPSCNDPQVGAVLTPPALQPQSNSVPLQPARQLVSRTFTLSDASDDCGVQRSRTDVLCLDTSATVSAWTEPLINSANCNSSITALRRDPANAHCILADVNLRGCGYDQFPLGIRNCRGRGWIGGSIVIKCEHR
jgi:hypothetical protein